MKPLPYERVNSKSSPSWSEAKGNPTEFDRVGLPGLLQDFYTASKENQAFLHACLGLGDDALEPYKATIDRWLRPDVLERQDISVAKAKKALSDYKKARGDSAGLAELMVHYCECASGFCSDVGLQDEGYFDALARMFEQALKITSALPDSSRRALRDRLDAVRRRSHDFGHGVSDDIDELCSRSGIDDGAR